MAKDETKGESLNDAAVISAFKDKTKEKFHELDGMDPETIEANVKTIVQGIVNDYGMDVIIEDVVVSGSRCRGMEEKGADLDVVLYYSGSVREDDLFNTLNQGNIIMGVMTPMPSGNSRSAHTGIIFEEKAARSLSLSSLLATIQI